MSPTVLVYDPIQGIPWSYEPERVLLERAGVRLVVPENDASRDDALAIADVVIVCTRIQDEVLSRLPRCVGLVCYGVGMNAVSAPAAAAAGLPVANVPGFCTEEVATHALTLILALNRSLPSFAAAGRQGTWDLATIEGFDRLRRLSGACIGVVGLGRIGSQVSRSCLALGCQVVGYDPHVAASPVDGVDLVTWDELLARSDTVVLCASLQAGSGALLDDAAFRQMRPGASLVNVARGGLVDEAALAAALASGHLSGAALDVRATEPPPGEDTLAALPNVILTPHMAAISHEADADLHRGAVASVLQLLRDSGQLASPMSRRESS
jgi:phosphoglycerate dehydrogenase-like enzyme